MRACEERITSVFELELGGAKRDESGAAVESEGFCERGEEEEGTQLWYVNIFTSALPVTFTRAHHFREDTARIMCLPCSCLGSHAHT